MTLVQAWAPSGIGEIRDGDDLGEVLGAAIEADGGLRDGDIVVVTSKVVSKSEGRSVPATQRDRALAEETVRVVARREHAAGTTVIVENRLGIVAAAAGIDASNVPEGTILLLPVDPDASARRLRESLNRRFQVTLGVIISDTTGRAWRVGQTDIAIGAAGLRLLHDYRGQEDTHGRVLDVSVTAVADEVTALADLAKGKVEGRPVCVVRGLERYVLPGADDGASARTLNRDAAMDMFRLGTDEAIALGRADGGRP